MSFTHEDAMRKAEWERRLRYQKALEEIDMKAGAAPANEAVQELREIARAALSTTKGEG